MAESYLIEQFETFFQNFKLYQYKKRSLILKSNDATSSVFYIKSGFIRVFRISENGEELTLAILKSHDFFPLTYGIGNTNQSYYLEAITPLELWKAPQELFIEFIKKDPELFYELTQRLLIRFDGVLARIESMAFSNAYTKVATILLMCAKGLGESYGEQIILKVPLTHKDIATMIGITRETTSLEMKKLERKGLVKRQGKYLIIADYEKLEEECLHLSPAHLLSDSTSVFL
jgi:CRP/FNR family transcriptional regulator